MHQLINKYNVRNICSWFCTLNSRIWFVNGPVKFFGLRAYKKVFFSDNFAFIFDTDRDDTAGIATFWSQYRER